MRETEATPDADSGPRDRGGVERLCVVTRGVKPVDQMVRFVAGPDDALVPDLKGKLPGRGVWVTATRRTVETAVARNAFARSLKRPVKVTAGLCDEIERLLERAALDALGVAVKAGLVEAGFTKTEAALARGRAVALLQAAEAAPDGVRKLANAARRNAEGEAKTMPILIFAAAQLDLALGRPNVIHAALLAGPACETLLARWRRLEGFRGEGQAKPVEKRGQL